MSAKEPQKTEYAYADVERALAEVFGVDAEGRRGWLRGRLTNFRRFGLSPAGPGKGRTIAYDLEDVEKWLIGLELMHFRFDPTLIVEFINRTWSRPDGKRTAAEAFDRGEAALHDLVSVARAGELPDVLITIRFEAMSLAPVIGYTTLRGVKAFARWLSGEEFPSGAPRRAAIFNLSDRLRRLDRALAAPPPPPLPGGVAGFILKAGRRGRGEER